MSPTKEEQVKEIAKLLMLIRKLSLDKQVEVLCMLKSAAIIADKCA